MFKDFTPSCNTFASNMEAATGQPVATPAVVNIETPTKKQPENMATRQPGMLAFIFTAVAIGSGIAGFAVIDMDGSSLNILAGSVFGGVVPISTFAAGVLASCWKRDAQERSTIAAPAEPVARRLPRPNYTALKAA